MEAHSYLYARISGYSQDITLSERIFDSVDIRSINELRDVAFTEDRMDQLVVPLLNVSIKLMNNGRAFASLSTKYLAHYFYMAMEYCISFNSSNYYEHQEILMLDQDFQSSGFSYFLLSTHYYVYLVISRFKSSED